MRANKTECEILERKDEEWGRDREQPLEDSTILISIKIK